MQTLWQDLRYGARMLSKNLGFTLVAALTLLWPAATVISQSATPPATDKYADKLRLFEEFARRQMEKDKTPGITIGFYKDDYTWVKGFGYADLENQVPATANSVYRLASTTKTFTGVAILQLVEKGKLKRAFANAEVYPNLIDELLSVQIDALLSVQERPQSIKASKLAVDLYPHHPRTNAVWGVTLALADTSEERREMFKKAVGDIESPLEYFKKSLALNPSGLASAGLLNRAAREWASQKRIDDALALLKVAVELHPKSAQLNDALGDLYQQKGQKELARQAYEKAVEADPNFEHAKMMLKKLTP